MKRFSLLVMIAALLLFFAGCGDGGNDYDKYDDGDSGKKDDSTDTAPDKDQSDTSDTSDTDTDTQPDDDSGTPDGEPTDPDDTDTTPSHDDFWASCEGIIACSNGCKEEDSECRGDCYGKGNEEGQLNYRRWRECFDDKCAEDKTAECSAENCAEWDELCNVAEAWDYEVTIPAPYGTVSKLKGDFSYILDNVFPSSETGVVFSGFAEGNISSILFPQQGTTVSFVKKGVNKRDGEVLDVYQAPFDTQTQKIGSPVVILRIKLAAATAGEHDLGVLDENDARLIVVEMDGNYAISCYHAFGTGSFSISNVKVETGSAGQLKFSGSGVDLFHPQNIPELGGDARETLGVEACSIIW